MAFTRDALKRWNGRDVRIVLIHPDPSFNVLVVEVANPDIDHMVPRAELHDIDVDDDLHCDHADGCCRADVGLPCDEE